MTTYNTNNPVPSVDVRDLYDNAENLDIAINSESPTFIDRMGQARLTLSGYEDAATGVPAIDASISAAESAEQAETARDAAFINADVYASTAAGLSATTVGAQFQVVLGDEIIRYRHDSGPVAVEVARYPGVTGKIGQLTNLEVPGIAGVGVAFRWEDAGNVAMWLGSDGALRVPGIVAETINGNPSGNGRQTNGARLVTQINYVCGYGQSLGEGSTPEVAITTVQEYDLVGFPARDPAPVGWLPLTVANTQFGTRGESPIYGTLGHIKKLIQYQHGLEYTQDDYLLIGGNCAVSGQTIADLSKGGTYYPNVIGQVTAAKTLADGLGKTMACPAVTFTQGEADAATDPAVYKAALKTLAVDFDADIRAITAQALPTLTITYQTATRDMDLAQAQLEAALEHPLIVQACPMYQLEYGDSLHITAASSQRLGGYYGLAYKYAIIDGADFQPLQPIGHFVSGSTISLTYNRSGLVLDTTSIPAFTNSGFAVFDGGGTPVTISGVAVVSPNRVRITVSGTPAIGWRVEYGVAASGRSDAFVGLGGNLRDNTGESLRYKGNRMDNWCMINRYQL
jgi:hypothetical protein